nr:hypothetical protein [Bacillota bacterium]
GSTAHFLIGHSPIETSLDLYQNTSFSEFESPEGVLSLQVSRSFVPAIPQRALHLQVLVL